MKIKFFSFFLVHCLLSTVYCYGQSSNLDSLLGVLKTSKEDTSKVKVLNALFLEYEFNDEAKAKECLEKAMKLANSLQYKSGLALAYMYSGYFEEDKSNYSKAQASYLKSLKIYSETDNKDGVAKSYNNIGNVNKSLGNYPEALRNYYLSLKIREELSDKKGIATIRNNIGTICYEQGRYQEALKNYSAAIKMYESWGDSTSLATGYSNIGIVYFSQKNYKNALNYYFASLNMRRSLGDKRGQADSYNNIGVLYNEQKKYDEALMNHLASLVLVKTLGDKQRTATSNSNIGNVYMGQSRIEKDPVVAEKKLELSLSNQLEALKLREIIGDTSGIVLGNTYLGEIYTIKKEYQKAEKYLLHARDLASLMGYAKDQTEIYNNLRILYHEKGEEGKAYENYEMYILFKDSMQNEESNKKLMESLMNYEFDKKKAVAEAEHKKELENQKMLAEEKSRKQNIVLFFILGSLLLVLIFAAFIFRSLRMTNRQKNIIEKHQKEMIDSITYARRIQQSLLPTVKYIEQSLKRLNKK